MMRMNISESSSAGPSTWRKKAGRGRRLGGNGGSDVLDEERLDAERARLVSERQSALAGVVDKHDDLVREVFHLEKFVSMVAFDPKAAKEDQSAVFQEYKAGYDLFEKVSSDTTSPTRKTRSAHSERLQNWNASMMNPPSAPPRKKPKSRRSSFATPSTDAIWDIISSAKGKSLKGKSVANDDDGRGGDSDELPWVDRGASVKKKGKERATEASLDDDSTISGYLADSSRAVGHREDFSTLRPGKRRMTDPQSADGPLPSPRKRRKTDGGERIPIRANGHSGHHDVQSLSISQAGPSAVKPPTRSSARLTSLSHSNLDTPSGSQATPIHNGITDNIVTPSPFKIKRIKLLVRRPPPTLSHPRQRPPAPRYGGSLATFLSSYKTLCGRDLDDETVTQMAQRDAAVMNRIDSFRRQGRLLPSSDEFVSNHMANGVNGKPSALVAVEPKRGPDLWDYMISVVTAQARVRKSHGRHVASQIASKIQAYWDGYAAKKDKAILQEEKRLRALAKSTVKMVISEWKKAVFHIRDQERLRIEAEEMRLGNEHLDAILDQSGQILETQHVDLRRRDLSRSRSRSSTGSDRLTGLEVETSSSEDEEEATAGSENDDGFGDEMAAPDIGETGDWYDGDASSLSRAGTIEPEESTLALLPDGPRLTSEGADSDDEDESYSRAAVDEMGSSSRMRSRSSSPVGLDVTDDAMGDPVLSPLTLLPPARSPEVSDLIPQEAQGPASTHTHLGGRNGIFDIVAVVEIHKDDLIKGDGEVVEDFQPVDVVKSSKGLSTLENVDLPDSIDDATTGLAQESAVSLMDDRPDEKDRVELLNGECSEGLSMLENRDLPDPMDNSTTVLPEVPTISQINEEQDGDDRVQLPNGQIPEGLSMLENEDLPDPMDETTKVPPELSPTSQINGLSEGKDGEDSPVGVSGDATLLEVDEPLPQEDIAVPDYLKPYAVAPVDWDPESVVKPPLLLRGILRPYQQSGLEWLASLHTNHLNGILADEMGLGKTIQSIALLAHLACDRGVWGPHLIVVPTSVLLNWEMEFKKFLPGFKILSYHGSTKRRKELRQGWNDKHHFNVCITSYTLASRDAHIFKRKAWYYMILDEAHMIKNFKSQRWNILLMFRSFRRLLLTGTPLQNNLTELWALLQFLMSGSNFANLKEFGEWFSNPLEKAIEMGNALDDETLQRVSKLHTVLRPYLLRRLKRDVEKELPQKYDHLVLCPLSKRQRFLYDEFLSRSQTQDALQSGIYQKVANILMQLRKVCNHPDLFEVRPIVTSFAMERSAIADFEIEELLIRRRLLNDSEETLNLGVLGLQFADRQNTSIIAALESRRLEATSRLPFASSLKDPPPKDTRSIAGFKQFMAHHRQAETMARWSHIRYLNRLRCNRFPVYSQEIITIAKTFYDPLLPSLSVSRPVIQYIDRVDIVNSLVQSHAIREANMADVIDKFAFVTPPVVARDLPRLFHSGSEATVREILQDPQFDAVLHRSSVKLQIAFPDPSLLQYDCGKLQELTRLLREKKAGGHRVLIFTQMTKILDILEVFLNFHGYLYLRLDGATKIEDRQYITERFNADSRVFCFIASSRSGGVGINLTGADTVVFYDSDFNPQMDRQCEDRAHRIGQIRDVHIYRFISQHTVEEAMLRKANQKRSLDDLVIQKGEFDWRSLFGDEAALTKALGEFEDTEDAHAAAVAAREEVVMEGADEADFGDADVDGTSGLPADEGTAGAARNGDVEPEHEDGGGEEIREEDPEEEAEDEGGTTVEYMLSFVSRDYEFFRDWRL